MRDNQAHKKYAAACFNRTWDLLDLSSRTTAEQDEMVECAHASLWHWMQREDGTPTNLSVGLWQISRVYATVGNPAMAKEYAERCERVSREGSVAPFFLAYALEARARAEALDGNAGTSSRLISEAQTLAELVDDDGGRIALLADLDTIPRPTRTTAPDPPLRNPSKSLDETALSEDTMVTQTTT